MKHVDTDTATGYQMINFSHAKKYLNGNEHLDLNLK